MRLAAHHRKSLLGCTDHVGGHNSSELLFAVAFMAHGKHKVELTAWE